MVVPIRRHGGLLYKSPTGGNVDGHACMHRYISIGRDNRYEHEVTPLGGTRMRIPVAARKLLCSEVLLGLISMVVPIRRHGGLLYKSPDGKHVDAVLAQADTCLSDGTTGMSK